MVAAFGCAARLGRSMPTEASLGLFAGCWLSGRRRLFDAGGSAACSSGVGVGPEAAVEPGNGAEDEPLFKFRPRSRSETAEPGTPTLYGRNVARCRFANSLRPGF